MVDQQPRNLLDQQAIDALTAGRNFLANVTSEGSQSLTAEYSENVKRYAGELLAVLESPVLAKTLKLGHHVYLGYNVEYPLTSSYSTGVDSGIKIVRDERMSGKRSRVYYTFEDNQSREKIIWRVKEAMGFKKPPHIFSKGYGYGNLQLVYVPLSPEDCATNEWILQGLIDGATQLFRYLNANLEQSNSKKRNNLELLMQANEILGGLK